MIKNLLLEGFALKEQGYYKKAIEVFYKALEEDNSSLELLLEIAELYYLIQKEERTLNYIERILDKCPTHVEALKLLEKIFIDKNNLSEAEKTAENIYLISRCTSDLVNLLRIMNAQKEYEKVIQYSISQNNTGVNYEIAYAKFHLKNFEEAEKLTKEVLNQDKDNVEAKLLLGKIYYAENKLSECSKIAKELETGILDGEILNFLGLVYAQKGFVKKAEEYFINAIKLEKRNDLYYYNLANFYMTNGKLSLAQKNYNHAISLAPENENYHYAMANLHYLNKNYKRALEEIKGDDVNSRLLKAIILYDTGYYIIARKEIREITEQYPENNVAKKYLELLNNQLELKNN